MREPGNDDALLTLILPLPKGDLLRACLALCHQAKNLTNTSLYVIRQVMSAYIYNTESKTYVLKPSLHDDQIAAISAYNQHIVNINARRTAKHPAQVAKAIVAGATEPVLKLVEPLSTTMENLAATVLDVTLVNNVVKGWKNNRGDVVFKRLPGAMAQQTIGNVLDSFKGFYAATKQFIKDPSCMTGKPKMPHYLEKTGRTVIEIPLAHVHTTLPTQRCKAVPEDYAETVMLPDEVLAVFSSFDVTELITAACKKRGWAEFKPRHLRIVPTRSGVKMEVVVQVKHAYPKASFLAKLTATHGPEITGLKTQKERNTWLHSYLARMSVDKLPRIAGVDLGIANIAAVAYSTGHKAEVHSGGRFDAVVGQFNDKVDRFIASKSSPRAKELQKKKKELQEKKKDEKLPLAEHIELNSLLKVAYAEPEYRRLTEKKQRWLDNYLHNLSNSIVQRCVAKRIDVIVVGKNKGWKQESNIGKKQNRKFCQLAHARLIDFIKYKADHHGIAVVTTEESYTSKTSFVNGDTLEIYEETRALAKGTPRPAKSGKRSQDDRNRFVHTKRIDRWTVVHADVNGAFNIIRKVFVNFAYSVKLTLKYTLLRLSPRLGVVPL